MDDKQIRDFFSKFNPVPASSDDLFIERLRSNIESVQLVKDRIKRIQSVYRRAALFASLAGFITGLIFSILLNHFIPVIKKINFSYAPEMDMTLVGWVGVAFISIFFTILSCRLSISCLRKEIDLL